MDLTAGRDKFLIYLIHLHGSPCLHFNSLFHLNFLGMRLNILTSSPTSCRKHVLMSGWGSVISLCPEDSAQPSRKCKSVSEKGENNSSKPQGHCGSCIKLRLPLNTVCCSCDPAAADEPYPVFLNTGLKLLQLTFCLSILNSHSIAIISGEPACRGSRKGLSGQC